jgi:D-sedoheptulose 7-phosphate isomerase
MTFSQTYLKECAAILEALDADIIERLALSLQDIRERGGRLFVLGVGGSAANAAHVVNDFRKLGNIETYSPTDNVAELTARTNDEGWESTFVGWLKVSRLQAKDGLLVLSVGGGNRDVPVSPNLIAALDLGKSVGATILGIVGRDGGVTARIADVCLIVPTVATERITPHAEEMQGVIWHLLISHPAVQYNRTKWESVATA